MSLTTAHVRQLRKRARRLRHDDGDEPRLLYGGPLDATLFPVPRTAKPGAIVGLTCETPSGPAAAYYVLGRDGRWTFREVGLVAQGRRP